MAKTSWLNKVIRKHNRKVRAAFAVVCKVRPGAKKGVTVGKYRTKKAARRVAAGAKAVGRNHNPYGACRVVKRRN